MHLEGQREGASLRFRAHTAGSAAGAMEAVGALGPDLVIMDMMLPDGSALGILPELMKRARGAPILVITAHHDMETTIRAMKLGAFDYLHKPFHDPAVLDLAVARALEMRRLSRRAAAAPVELQAKLGDIVGVGGRIQQISKEIGKVAASHASVLVTGESGTGKELIARVIHNYSHNYSDERPRSFVGINCSAIVDTLLESELFGHEKGAFIGAQAARPGRFELADDGAVFLDEIGDMSLPLQAKILRVLQERDFERVGGVRRIALRARVIAATNRSLPDEVAAGGHFREDLYQRLKASPSRSRPCASAAETSPPSSTTRWSATTKGPHARTGECGAGDYREAAACLTGPGRGCGGGGDAGGGFAGWPGGSGAGVDALWRRSCAGWRRSCAGWRRSCAGWRRSCAGWRCRRCDGHEVKKDRRRSSAVRIPGKMRRTEPTAAPCLSSRLLVHCLVAHFDFSQSENLCCAQDSQGPFDASRANDAAIPLEPGAFDAKSSCDGGPLNSASQAFPFSWIVPVLFSR